MTVKELKELLANCDDNAEVTLADNRPVRDVCQLYTPFVSIKERTVRLS